MFDFSSLSLSPEDSRAARNYLGFSQAKAAKESGLPDHKIKRFEAGNYIPDPQFLQDLRAFFETRGYEFKGTPRPGDSARDAGRVFPAGVVGAGEETAGVLAVSRPQRATFHHMRIALTDEAQMGRVLDLIESNEQQAEELLGRKVETGFFGGLSESSQAIHAEALKLLAENGKLFALLFGRSIGESLSTADTPAKASPATQAELLNQRQADVRKIVAGDKDALAKHRAKKPAESLLGALFG